MPVVFPAHVKSGEEADYYEQLLARAMKAAYGAIGIDAEFTVKIDEDRWPYPIKRKGNRNGNQSEESHAVSAG